MNILIQNNEHPDKKRSLCSGNRNHRGRAALWILSALLFASAFAALQTGASQGSITALVYHFLIDGKKVACESYDYIILIEVRLPRLILGALVGSALAVSGVLMQGLFRNPLADPGITGVSSGAALGAAGFIVLAPCLPEDIFSFFGSFGLLSGAFTGGATISILLYAVATRHGRTSIATMLLAGIAVAALTGAILGILVFLADDKQLRDISFWSLGSLAGATWQRISVASPFILSGLLFAFFLARSLNALSLGEAVAGHLGFSVQSVKNRAILFISLMCGTAVSVSGGIGFVGIVIPHILRLVIGPDHRYLLPCSALLGAIMLIFADIFSRSLMAPAELPIGIVTAAFGSPFFLWILLRQRGIIDL